MHCPPPRKIKRYMTDPDEFGVQQKSKYSNLTLQQLKLHLIPLDTLHQINVPSVCNNRPNPQKLTNHFLPLHPKFHLRRNPLKRLPDLNMDVSNTNGSDAQKPSKNQQPFKRSNPLFVVNTLIDILKEDHPQKSAQPLQKKSVKDKRFNQSNEFSEFEGKSVKIQRAPRLVEGELNRLTQQSNFSRRKIYSQQKSRQKGQPEVQLLTFYKPKRSQVQQKNQFLV